MNKYLYLIILFIHNVSSFILPPKINSISLFRNYNHHNHITTFMKKNNKNDNYKNKTKIYKITFNNDHLRNNDDNEILFYKLITLTLLSVYLYQIIYYLLLLS